MNQRRLFPTADGIAVTRPNVVPLFRKFALYCDCPAPISERIALFDAVQCTLCLRPFHPVASQTPVPLEGL